MYGDPKDTSTSRRSRTLPTEQGAAIEEIYNKWGKYDIGHIRTIIVTSYDTYALRTILQEPRSKLEDSLSKRGLADSAGSLYSL